jgi:type II secretory pathway pseudopilin PulG
MSVLKNKKGVSLIEIILAIGIFALIAFPLINVFVQSINIDRKASDIVNANYIAQEYIENLDSVTYTQALSNLPNYESIDDYSFSAKIIPYGTMDSLFDDRCSYVHIIMYDESGSTLCVMPDGSWHIFSSVPSTFSLTLSSGVYTFKGGFTTLTGTSKYNNCAMIVNAMKKPVAAKSAITLGGNCRGALYIKSVDSGDITFSGGASSIYEDFYAGDTSLVYVTTALYNPSKESIIATSDNYISIRNW